MTPDGVSDARVLTSQVLAVMVKNIVLLGIGMANAYPTILIPALLSEENKHIGLTKDSVSWIGSMQFICGTVGTILSGPCSQFFGRKRFLQILSFPLSVAWTCLAVSTQFWHVYLGLLLIGLFVGLCESPMISYLAEVTQTRLRGMLSASNSFSVALGMLIQVCFGTFLSWQNVAYVSLIVPISAFVWFCFVPETPHWLIMHKKFDRARRSLAWLRGWAKVDEIELEYQEMCRDLQVTNENASKLDSFRNYTNKNFYRPFLLVTFTSFLSLYSGFVPVFTYSVNIFRTLQVPVDAYYATIILGVCQLTGCVISTITVKYLGKRTMALTSIITLAIVECASGFYVHSQGIPYVIFDDSTVTKKTNENWISLTLLLLISFVANCGLRNLSFMLVCEVFTHETRALGGGLFATLYYVLYFSTNKVFVDLADFLTFPGILWFYCCVNFFGAAVLYFMLLETEGRTLKEIVDHFSGKSFLLSRKELSLSFMFGLCKSRKKLDINS